LINEVFSAFIQSPISNFPTGSSMLNYLLFMLLLMIPVSLLHEAVHGALYFCFGCRVRFGFKLIYTQETSGKPLSTVQFVIVLLSPLLLLSVPVMFFRGWIVCTMYLLNLLGSSGDIYMALSLLKSGGIGMVVDREYGYDVIKAASEVK
jgi:4-amino-4-deoxy-L-arabinose transferase-like glycosyltransferase